jgi:hypothetical protein
MFNFNKETFRVSRVCSDIGKNTLNEGNKQNIYHVP